MSDSPTKRRVEVSIGVPDMLENAPVTGHPEMAHPAECYFLTFVDAVEPDGSHNTLSAQTTCLCALPEAAAAWLQGATEEEVQAILVGGHADEGDHDEGEEWKKS